MRKGVRFSIDYGDSRIGLAASDPDGILASPLKTILNNQSAFDEILAELPNDCLEIYVGLPLNMVGDETIATSKAIDFASELSTRVAIPIRFIDERLTTALANTQLRQIGKSQKQARGIVDQMAAVAILEYALNMERANELPPGEDVSKWVSRDE